MGLTRSPQAEFFGFWSRRGPASPMKRAPTGAVRRMASTATVSTSMPYFCSCLSSFVRAMSKAVEPIAAWRRQVHWCFLYAHSQMTFTITTRGNLKEIGKKNIFGVCIFNLCVPKEKQHLQISRYENECTYTCTVALGIHARAMNTFSLMLKPAHNTHTKVKRTRTSRAMSREAMPRPTQTNRQQ